MAGRNFYYRDTRIFPKIWQRHLFAGICSVIACYLANRYQILADERYSTFRGKTYLYGTDSINAGKHI